MVTMVVSIVPGAQTQKDYLSNFNQQFIKISRVGEIILKNWILTTLQVLSEQVIYSISGRQMLKQPWLILSVLPLLASKIGKIEGHNI